MAFYGAGTQPKIAPAPFGLTPAPKQWGPEPFGAGISLFGAGAFFRPRPAPPESVEWRFMVKVPLSKSHLRRLNLHLRQNNGGLNLLAQVSLFLAQVRFLGHDLRHQRV